MLFIFIIIENSSQLTFTAELQMVALVGQLFKLILNKHFKVKRVNNKIIIFLNVIQFKMVKMNFQCKILKCLVKTKL